MDIQALAREFARDPDSLVFLRLGEGLRRKGDLESATAVALSGLERYPDLPAARDLYARLLLDASRPDEARHVWETVLQRDARHQGAHKGLGFLYYSRGDLDAALEHLETALAVDPTDQSVLQAFQLVRTTARTIEEDDEEPNIFAGLEGAEHGLLLVDDAGRVLAGRLGGNANTDEMAARVAALVREAERTARLLDLGKWEWLIAESASQNVHLTQPTNETCLVTMRDRSVPPGRLAFLAQKANDAARGWLEGQRP